jgi:hypothetical protein
VDNIGKIEGSIKMKRISSIGFAAFFLLVAATTIVDNVNGFHLQESKNTVKKTADQQQQQQQQQKLSRRNLFEQVAKTSIAAAFATGSTSLLLVPSQPAFASGGATAGKYT